MTVIVGLSGSLREGSFNTMLLREAERLMPPGARLEVRTIRGIPLYDGDVEKAEGIPPAVAELKEAIVAAAGLLVASPEYNNSCRAFSRTRWTGCRGRRRTSSGCSGDGPWR